ncbi:TIR domain-containing protein [Paenarthrobacter sp. YJN-D]|uniref:TIR domain-containing protein n=1 Tax=Paenarthrobacter sp. YJN-D TaxID=2735317 RepID=UPI0018786C7F|nr:nucleotide-binding protein [Paenarthrobacter sp. YJN-D]QOT22521.1 nucleotide-binding protein [Paenarthrobacter sp. YJN-D]
MELSRKLELLDEQITAANDGTPTNFSDWKDETGVVLRTLVGQDSPLYSDFSVIRFSPSIYNAGTDITRHRQAGVRKAMSLLRAAKKQLMLSDEARQAALSEELENLIVVADKGNVDAAGRIFIVHGHDGEKKHELARFLLALTGHEPVILHEQPNKGTVLMEKLEASAASTGYAVALLTADDLGKAKSEDDLKPRGRQNVVFEMGFFMGALGRKNVAVLYDDGVEEPGDMKGFVYTALDAAGGWKTKIAREIEAAGIDVNWSALGQA